MALLSTPQIHHSLLRPLSRLLNVAISSLADMEVLFDQIRLADVIASMTINSPAAVIWAMYLAITEKQERLEENLRHPPERHPQDDARDACPARTLHAPGH